MKQTTPDTQQQQWQRAFARTPEMFGATPSYPARRAAEVFRQREVVRILELGCGQGRDTHYFARCGFEVHALDYSDRGLAAIDKNAPESHRIVTKVHDVRTPLPFADGTFDACYSHMLFCMALTTRQLLFLSAEVRRVLRPGGICFYTVRHTGDSHYRAGIHRGGDMYETGGFVVHFFSREKVELLAAGYEIIGMEEFTEGELPRRLFPVTLQKTP